MDFSKCSLMLMVTLGCNSRCGHCCLSSSPERIGECLSTDEMIDYIKDAYRVGIDDVVFTGGEPMLYFREMHKPLELAHSLGMFIDIRTNASWAKDKETARKVLGCLESVGLGRLGLSYDLYHNAYIPSSYIGNAIDVATEMGIDFYLDWIGNEAEDEILEYLHIDNAKLRFTGQPLKAGRAKELKDTDFNVISIGEVVRDNYNCTNDGSPLLSVFPNGYGVLHQCCWVHPYLIRRIQGNNWIRILAKEMEGDYAVNLLGKYGVAGLIEWARENKPQLLKAQYSHPCEVCYDLLALVSRGLGSISENNVGIHVAETAGVR